MSQTVITESNTSNTEPKLSFWRRVLQILQNIWNSIVSALKSIKNFLVKNMYYIIGGLVGAGLFGTALYLGVLPAVLATSMIFKVAGFVVSSLLGMSVPALNSAISRYNTNRMTSQIDNLKAYHDNFDRSLQAKSEEAARKAELAKVQEFLKAYKTVNDMRENEDNRDIKNKYKVKYEELSTNPAYKSLFGSKKSRTEQNNNNEDLKNADIGYIPQNESTVRL